MLFDNVIIHYYPFCECVAQCAVNLRRGNKIVYRIAIKDPRAAAAWLERNKFYKPVRTIIHWQ